MTAPVFACSAVFLRVKDFAHVFANERVLREVDRASHPKSFVRATPKHLQVKPHGDAHMNINRTEILVVNDRKNCFTYF